MKPQNEVSIPNGCRKPPKETRTSTKKCNVTRTTDTCFHFIKYSSADGLDAPQVYNRQTDEPIKGPQAKTDASHVAPPQNTCGDMSMDTKQKHWSGKPAHRHLTYDL